MVHGSARRLLATAAGPSLLRRSPAVHLVRQVINQVNPEVWDTVQPPPSAALSAFVHRIGLSAVLNDTKLVEEACTHPSILQIYVQHFPELPKPPTNETSSSVGNALLGLFASEYLHTSYPHLPTRVLKAAVSAYVGPATCAAIAREMGAQQLLRWHRTVSSADTRRHAVADPCAACDTSQASPDAS
jgi:dsRNA-specific ribonuclease